MRPEEALALSPWRAPLLGLENLTPASRRELAGVLAAASTGGLVPALLAPDPFAAVAIGAALIPVAAAAWHTAKEARKPFYLNPSPGALRLEQWEVVPGVRAGPFELGPPGADALAKLRLAHACWYFFRTLTYVIRTGPCWVAACLTTDLETPPEDGFREYASLKELVWVETSCISHATPDGVCPGMEAREAVKRLGPPEKAHRTGDGLVRMEYRGLTLHVRRGHVASLRVLPTSFHEALKPWQVV